MILFLQGAGFFVAHHECFYAMNKSFYAVEQPSATNYLSLNTFCKCGYKNPHPFI